MQNFIKLSAREFTPDQWAELYNFQLTDTHDHSTPRRFNVERSMIERAVKEMEGRVDGISVGLYNEHSSPAESAQAMEILRGAVSILQGKLGQEVAA